MVKWHLLFPLASSLIYVAGVLLIKRASDYQVGVWRTTFVCNILAAVIFLALLPFGGRMLWADLWQPALVAGLFFAGQILSFRALERGDVSVVTPALGVKTLVVALGSTLFLTDPLPWQMWASAVMSFLAIALLNGRGKLPRQKGLGGTIVLSLLAASCYAMGDVVTQKFAPAWGAGRFLPIAFALIGLLSLGLIPLFRAPLSAIPRRAWPWLIGGGVLIGVQAICLITALAVFGDATAMNVIYSARGLWSVAAVWLIGHWFANREQHLESAVLRFRFIGAILMTTAIVITVSR